MSKAFCPPQRNYKSNRNRDGRNTSEIPALVFGVHRCRCKIWQFACLNLPGYFWVNSFLPRWKEAGNFKSRILCLFKNSNKLVFNKLCSQVVLWSHRTKLWNNLYGKGTSCHQTRQPATGCSAGHVHQQQHWFSTLKLIFSTKSQCFWIPAAVTVVIPIRHFHPKTKTSDTKK